MITDLFDAVPDALVVVDDGGRIVRANGHAERLFGYPPDALAGLEIEALLPEPARGRHVAHRDRYMAQPHVRPMGATGQTLVGLRRDGTEFPLEIALSPLASDDGTRYLASVRDISDTQRQRQALVRARYDTLVARIGQLALEAPGETAVIEAVPPLLAEALGVESVAIVLAAREGLTVEIRAAAGPLWKAGDAGSASSPSPATPITIQDSADDAASRDSFPVPLPAAGSAALMPLLDRGRVTGALVAAASVPRRFDHDALHLLQSVANMLSAFLQQRRAEEQLAHSQRLDAIGQLTGGIAHDFNNLLTVLSGSLQLLETECESADARDLIASALRSVGRGAELTGKLLAFARRQRLMPQSVDVHALLQDVMLMLKRTLGDTIRLQVECSEHLPPAYADPGQLESALVNLALNARDAMLGGGEISIAADEALIGAGRAHGGLPPGDYLRITVADTGRGMTAETLARAMEPFFTTKESGRGSGLGLSMVYGFARQSRGGLDIDSALGRGTRVALYLPVARDAAPAHRAAATGGAGGRGESVLVVEDDDAVRTIAVSFLRASGYRVSAVATAEEALQALREHPTVDLLFSDVMLGPGMNGKTLARQASAQAPALAVLLTSGYEDAADGEESGFELLRKPYRREQLTAAVARILAARGARAGRDRSPG